MHHHRWVVRVSRNVGMHGGAMTQLSRMGGHLGWGIAWLSHIHTHWTTPRHIIPWHTLQPCGEKEAVVSWAGGGTRAADMGPRSSSAGAREGWARAQHGMRSHGRASAAAFVGSEPTHGLTATAMGMMPRSKPKPTTPKNILPLLQIREVGEIKLLSAFTVRNVCDGDVSDPEACLMMTGVTRGGGTKVGKPCEGSQVGSIPRGLAAPPAFLSPLVKACWERKAGNL